MEKYISAGKKTFDSSNTSRVKSFVADVLGFGNSKTKTTSHSAKESDIMIVDDNNINKYLPQQPEIMQGYTNIYNQHKNRWETDIVDKDILSSNINNNNEKNDGNNEKFIYSILDKSIAPKSSNINTSSYFKSTNNNAGGTGLTSSSVRTNDDRINDLILEHTKNARDFITKNSVLYRHNTLQIHQNHVKNFSFNYSSMVNTHLSVKSSISLCSVNDYLQRIITARCCLMCAKHFTLKDNIGRYGCNSYNTSHTDNNNDVKILNANRTDIHGNYINPFDCYMGASAAYMLIPSIFLESNIARIGSNRLNILHVPAHTIIARYNSFKDLYENPLIVCKQGTCLLKYPSYKNTSMSSTIGTNYITDCYVPKDRIWIINVAELYFNSFINGLDSFSFNKENSIYATDVSNKDNLNNHYDGDDEMDYDEEEDENISNDENNIGSKHRWNNENVASRNKRRELELMAVKYGRTERLLFNTGSGKDIVDSVFNNLAKNPMDSKDMNPNFIPFVVIPKLASLTKKN